MIYLLASHLNIIASISTGVAYERALWDSSEFYNRIREGIVQGGRKADEREK